LDLIKLQDTKLAGLQNKIGYFFSKQNLLLTALTHKSTSDQNNNQRLEFLGDVILNFCIATHIFYNFIEAGQGDMTIKKAYLVSGKAILKLMEFLNFKECILTGIKVKLTDKIIEGCFEAIIGAIYMDSDLDTANRVIISLYEQSGVMNEAHYLHPKTQLKEIIQKRYGFSPNYVVTTAKDDENQNIFMVELILPMIEKKYVAYGKSIKEAEFKASKEAILDLEINN
jgi:ribonuclease-3